MKARAALAFRPGSSPLHRGSAGAAFAFTAAFALAAFVHDSPLVLGAAGLAAGAAGLAAGAGAAVRAVARMAIPLALVMIVINALLYHRGETVLIRGWELPLTGDADITLESIVAGGVIGLRVLVVLVVFAVFSACVDPDRMLRALRPLARRSALTAALVTRLIPVAAADLSRLRAAAALRGPAAAPVGRGAMAKRLVAGSLDRSVDLAATLELRGHSLPPVPRERAPRDRIRRRTDLSLLAAALMCAGAALGGRLAGAGGFDTYPRLDLAADPLTLAVCLALAAAAAVPFGRWWR